MMGEVSLTEAPAIHGQAIVSDATPSEAAPPKPQKFELVGFKKFIRTNPISDRFPVLGFHHVDFWVADATNTAGRFSFGLGMPMVSRSNLSTGNTVCASYLLRSGSIRFLFSAPYADNVSTAAAAASPIPSFDRDAARRFSAAHGLGVRAVAVEVADASDAFRISVAHGARPAFPPTNLGQGFALSEVELYGDVVLRYISSPRASTSSPADDDFPSFLPGFEDLDDSEIAPLDYGFQRLDHAVGNVPDLSKATRYLSGFTGFHEFAEFTTEDVGTAESGLNSVALANNEETVLLPMNEPVHGTKRRSQIQTFLDHNGGPGLQHVALATDDVLKTLREMRARTKLGGFDFMPAPPPTYYHGVRRRAGDVLTEEQIKECEELGVLVDRDDQGVLLQIFTKPVGDRPTIFLEIIQRIGCMVKDDEGIEYQKGGCGGFGKGNFSELFKSIEEYEKSLEVKQLTAVEAS